MRFGRLFNVDGKKFGNYSGIHEQMHLTLCNLSSAHDCASFAFETRYIPKSLEDRISSDRLTQGEYIPPTLKSENVNYALWII